MRLILLPGMDGTSELFRDLIEELPPSLECESVRYPTDKSLSYAELEILVTEAIPANEPLVLLAESFSTPLAIRLAAKNPANLRGLVLCAGFATSPIRGWKRSMCRSLAPFALHARLPKRAVKIFLLGNGVRDSLVAAVTDTIARVQPEVLLNRLRAVFACDVKAELAMVRLPVFYIRARQDRLVPASSLEEMKRCNPGVDFVELDGPHMLLQAEPKKASQEVMEFIGRLSSPPTSGSKTTG
jgi:pimeloyl-[acyl-carrier protein] methyl ester esterase